MQGKDGSALLEFFWRAVYRALALRKENQHFAMAQAERAGLHGAQQVGVRVHRDQVNLPREPAHEWRDEVLAGADEEDVAEETEGQRTHYENGVNVTLVVGAEQECALPREVLPSGNAETEQHTCQKVAELHGDKRSGGEDQTRFQERSKFGIVFIHPAEQHPPGIGVPRGQSRWRVAGVPREHGLDQLAHGVDAVRDIVGNGRAEQELQAGKQLDALDRIEPQLEVDVGVRPDDGTGPRGFADALERARDIGLRHPGDLFFD